MVFFNEELFISSPLPVKETLAPSIYFRDIVLVTYALAMFVMSITFVEQLVAKNSSLTLLP